MPRTFYNDKLNDYLFMRRNYRLIIMLSIVLLTLSSLLVCIMFYQVLTLPKEPYFATTTSGQLIKLQKYQG